MRTLTSLFAATLVATLFLTASLSAQRQVMSPPVDKDRRGSNLIMIEGDSIAWVSVTWSAPQWKADYDKPGMLDRFKGQNVRLGKNWWTSLDTNVPLEISGKKLPAGAYFLGLHYTKDGEFHLVALDAKNAMQNSYMPWIGDQWKGGTHIPLKLNKDKLAKTAQKMQMALKADKGGSTGSFDIHWGKHELHADIKFPTADAQDSDSDK